MDSRYPWEARCTGILQEVLGGGDRTLDPDDHAALARGLAEKISAIFES